MRSSAARQEAIVFIPGKGTAVLDQSLEAVCDRLLVAFADSGARGNFTVGQPQHVRYGPANRRTSRRRSLVRTIGGRVRARLDIYGVDYASDIAQDYTAKPLALKCLMLLQTIFAFSRLLLPALGRRTPTGSYKRTVQMLSAVLLIIGVAVYSLIVMLVIAYQVVKALRPDLHLVPDFVNAALLVLAALGLATMSTRLQQLVDALVGDYVFMLEYFGRGRHQEQLVRQVTELVNHLDVHERYSTITILAYSFGAILAIDCLFPPASMPQMHVARVDNLVTLGCPLDYMRLFWPSHFARRRTVSLPPRRWVNIYSPRDVLSSIIPNDHATRAGLLPPTVPCENVSYPDATPGVTRWVDVFRLNGFVAHLTYWGDAIGETGCFGLLVSRLYAGAPLLT